MFLYKESSIKEMRDALKKGEVSSVDLVKEAKAIIEKENVTTNAFVRVFESAEKLAEEADKKRKTGDTRSLLGIPIAIKENIAVKGEEMTASSKILKGHKAMYDATVVSKLKEAGMIPIGYTNLDEFAMGSSTKTSCYGVTKNPYDKERVSGGSSGGSAASVAFGSVPVSLGTDTGGSVRQPAAYCGCFGLKPTYGSVSRYGLVALSSSLDVAGVIGRTMADTKEVFKVIEGYDENDSTSGTFKYAKTPENNKTIGVPRKFIDKYINKNIAEPFFQSIENLKQKGYKIINIEEPLFDSVVSMYYIIQPAEASSNLARYDGIRYGASSEANQVADQFLRTREQGFGDEAKRRILAGTFVLSSGYYDAYYKSANRARKKLISSFGEIFKEVSIIATPSATDIAPKIENKETPLENYVNDCFTVSANLSGNPALSVPIGVVDEMPIGLQLMASHNGEDTLFEVGDLFDTYNAKR
ncbi:MAG: Asp-tRNA(Asn)/Glu-tRNA(Gln) amidotransferase subunit GatA [Candidatus Campbellbacteria bacterium]|nr:Asp-tRNA(Asn)/Glu-tRNA(Gln) amidotransferase subunit GatA [Candidatus Campbellbacteria bacterium]